MEEYTIPGTGVTFHRNPKANHEFIPECDETYVFREELVEMAAYCLDTTTNCMLIGDAGAGKSSLVVQLAAHLRRPLRRLNLNGESDTTVLLGRDMPTMNKDGSRSMVYRRGPLAEAAEHGWWVLLDEIDAALQPVLFCLQQVLEDDGCLVLEDADATVIRPHKNFRIFATANTVGIAGRNRMLYSGTSQRMNEATLDRFGVLIHVPYMEAAQEEIAIQNKVPTLDSDFVKAIVKIANDSRKNLQDDRLSATFSTRRCIQWAQAMTRFHPVIAAKMTVLNKLNPDDFKVLEGVIQRYFGKGV
jgi:cobaltochelatase CobS